MRTEEAAVHVVIAGCGRVGAQLARLLDADGHSVAVIDKDRRSFRRLGEDFGGQPLHGIVFDRRTLEQAGIDRAEAFVAVTSGDNSNIVSARTAHEHYQVPRVVARIYDPARAGIYERLGVTTIAAAQWTVEEIGRSLFPEGEHVSDSLGPGYGDVAILSMVLPRGAKGITAEDVAVPGESVLVAVTREGRTAVPVPGGVLGAGDRLHVAVQRGALDKARARVAALGEESS